MFAVCFSSMALDDDGSGTKVLKHLASPFCSNPSPMASMDPHRLKPPPPTPLAASCLGTAGQASVSAAGGSAHLVAPANAASHALSNEASVQHACGSLVFPLQHAQHGALLASSTPCMVANAGTAIGSTRVSLASAASAPTVRPEGPLLPSSKVSVEEYAAMPMGERQPVGARASQPLAGAPSAAALLGPSIPEGPCVSLPPAAQERGVSPVASPSSQTRCLTGAAPRCGLLEPDDGHDHTKAHSGAGSSPLALGPWVNGLPSVASGAVASRAVEGLSSAPYSQRPQAGNCNVEHMEGIGTDGPRGPTGKAGAAADRAALGCADPLPMPRDTNGSAAAPGSGAAWSTPLACTSPGGSGFHATGSTTLAAAASLGVLTQEVAAWEVELRVLRQEVEVKEVEASRLRARARETDVVVMGTAGTVGTLSAQVETSATNRQAVLEAANDQVHTQVDTLRRRLAQKEWELGEKDEEIELLRQLAILNQEMAERQRGDLHLLQMSQEEQGLQVFQLAQDASRIKRHRAIGEWQKRVCARVSRESTDAALCREQRSWKEEITRLNEESTNLRAFIRRMDERCRVLVSVQERARQWYDSLVMEERLCDTAARLGQETIDEPLRARLMEHQALERQLKEELASRKSQPSAAAKHGVAVPPPFSRAGHDAQIALDQLELRVLADCVQEISRALTETAPGRADSDATDAAVRDCLTRMARMPGMPPLPPVVRVGARDYAVGGELLQCALVRDRLFARLPGGSLAPFEEVMRVHAMSSAVGPLPSATSPPSRTRPAEATRSGACGGPAWERTVPGRSVARSASPPASLRARQYTSAPAGQSLGRVVSLGTDSGSRRVPAPSASQSSRLIGRI